MDEVNNEKIPWINILSAWSGWLIDGFVSLTYVLTIVSNPAQESQEGITTSGERCMRCSC